MMTPEEKLISAIGDVSDRYVKLATGYRRFSFIRPDTGTMKEVMVTELPEPKLPWLKPALAVTAGLAAVAVLAAAGIMLGIIKAQENITPYVPPTASSGITEVIEEPLIFRSEEAGGHYMRVVFDGYEVKDGLRITEPDKAVVELVKAEDGTVVSSARFVTAAGTAEKLALYGDIEIRLHPAGAYFAAVVFVPKQDGGYYTTVYTTYNKNMLNDGLLWRTDIVTEVSSLDDIVFDTDADFIVINGTDHIGLSFYEPNPEQYDDNTPYEWLYRGKQRQAGSDLRFTAPVEGTDLSVEWLIPDIQYDDNYPYSFYSSSEEQSTVNIIKDGTRIASAPFISDSSDNAHPDLFDSTGSFNIITHTLNDGKALIFAGLPVNRRFKVSVYVYDGDKLGQFAELFPEIDGTLESIECDGTNRLTYKDVYNGDCNIILDFDTLSYHAAVYEENRAALEKLAELAGEGYSLPWSEKADTIIYDGEVFTSTKSNYAGDIFSVTDGTVQTVDWCREYQLYIDVIDNNGNVWTYTNCSVGSPYTYEGQQVRAGDKIASNGGGVTVRFNSPVVPPELIEPAVNYDTASAQLEGIPFDSSELGEFSVDKFAGQLIALDDEWFETHNPERGWWKAGEFFDSIGESELTEVFYKAIALDHMLITDSFTDLEGFKRSGASVSLPYPLVNIPDYRENYYSSGFTYESFRNAYFEAFTEEMALKLFNYFNYFVKYGDELYYVETAGGGDITRVYEEYELVSRSDDEIVFMKICYHTAMGSDDFTYHPELKDTYEKTYLTFRLVKEDGKWKVAFAPVQHW